MSVTTKLVNGEVTVRTFPDMIQIIASHELDEPSYNGMTESVEIWEIPLSKIERVSTVMEIAKAFAEKGFHKIQAVSITKVGA